MKATAVEPLLVAGTALTDVTAQFAIPSSLPAGLDVVAEIWTSIATVCGAETLDEFFLGSISFG